MHIMALPQSRHLQPSKQLLMESTWTIVDFFIEVDAYPNTCACFACMIINMTIILLMLWMFRLLALASAPGCDFVAVASHDPII